MVCYTIRKRLAALFFGLLLCLQAQAVVVTATATDLADSTPGQDQWQITYRIDGELLTDFGVRLLFPDSGYSDLAQGAVSAQLLPGVTPSIGGFDGLFDLIALSDIAVGDFAEATLTFIRLAPFGDQSFELLDDSFGVVGGGTLAIAITPTNDVPEPATWALMGLGVAMLGRTKGRRSRPTLAARA